MTIKFGVVMDPIATINYHKDTTLAMLWAAQARGWQLHYMEADDLLIHEGCPKAYMRKLSVAQDPQQWFTLDEPGLQDLNSLDVIFMRKDPPFDMAYIMTTYILELAERAGCLVVNKPQSLRDANEKLFTTWFPQCCVASLVTSRHELLRQFTQQHGDVILKPVTGMGGERVFRVSPDNPNLNVIIEVLTQYGQEKIMAQRYIPEIQQGDKRILMINGEPVPYALARIPQAGETRANLAAGGHGVGQPLSERDYWICQQVGPTLRDKGLYFVGLDVIGDYLTEINVTSPTCLRELDQQFELNIGDNLLTVVEQLLTTA